MVDLMNLFALKLLDTAISALKSIFMIKGRAFWSAVSGTVSYLFFILLLKKLTASNDTASILATLAAVFLGQYITQIISDKFDKENIWKISITPKTKQDGKEIADKLKEHNIPIRTISCYTDERVKVLGVDAYAINRAQSAIVHDLTAEYDAKFNIVEIRNRF